MLSQGMAPHRSDEDPSPLPRRRCTENVQRRPLDSPDVLLGQPCDIGTQYGGQGSNSVRGSTPRLSSSSYHRRNSSGDSSVARARGNHSVTLIRRDPTSGAQWNVARLLVSEPGSASPSRSERSLDKPPPDQEGGSRIQIDILNPGYNRFLHSSKASLQPASNLAAGAGDPNGNAAGEQGFRRQVFGGAARSRLGQSWNRRSVTRVGEGHGDTPLPESSNSNAPPARATVTQPAEADLGRASDRAFSFISPWDGTCEFSTGTSGRSLKVSWACVLYNRTGLQSADGRNAVQASRPFGGKCGSSFVGHGQRIALQPAHPTFAQSVQALAKVFRKQRSRQVVRRRSRRRLPQSSVLSSRPRPRPRPRDRPPRPQPGPGEGRGRKLREGSEAGQADRPRRRAQDG